MDLARVTARGLLKKLYFSKHAVRQLVLWGQYLGCLV